MQMTIKNKTAEKEKKILKNKNHVEQKQYRQATVALVAVIKKLPFTAVTIEELEGSIILNGTCREAVDTLGKFPFYVLRSKITDAVSLLLAGLFAETVYLTGVTSIDLPPPSICKHVFGGIFFDPANASVREKVNTLLLLAIEPTIEAVDFEDQSAAASQHWYWEFSRFYSPFGVLGANRKVLSVIVALLRERGRVTAEEVKQIRDKIIGQMDCLTIEESEQMAANLIGQYNLTGWEFSVNRAKRAPRPSAETKGYCDFKRKRILFPASVINNNAVHQVKQLMLLEIARALVGSEYALGRVWRNKVFEMGCSINFIKEQVRVPEYEV